MTTCTRCAISDWHPEARTCQVRDCELRQPPTLSHAAAIPSLGGRPLTGGGSPAAAGDLIDQPTRDSEADWLRREAEGLCIHDLRSAA